MRLRTYVALAVLGLALALFVSRFQAFPGYLDSDYYFGGGMALAKGDGFSDQYLWNYLDEPRGLPNPSHSYWMPLASIISAAGMIVTGETSYEAGRLGFLALAALAPLVTAGLSWRFSRRQDLALISGLLAVFSIYYAPFLPVPDNYGAYIVLGAAFLMLVEFKRPLAYALMGLVAGGMTLARSDGLIWLGMVGAAALLENLRAVPDSANPSMGRAPTRWLGRSAANLGLGFAGFLIVMGPWFFRNLMVHGSPMAPGGERLLWLTSYNDTFAYPADQLSPERWLAQGWGAIISVRWLALRWNLLNAFAAQGGVFLAPFIALGAWLHRRNPIVILGAFAWIAILIAMTVVFPFAGARGGFFHAGASLQSLWWVLAPLGLESAVQAARRRGMFTPSAAKIFGAAMVGIAVLMTAVVLVLRVFGGWGEGEHRYPEVEAFLQRSGVRPDEVVMVRNPPGYFVLTGRRAIVVPHSESSGILEAAERFGAAFLILEPAGAAGPIRSVYDGSGGSQFQLVGEIDGIRIFRIQQ